MEESCYLKASLKAIQLLFGGALLYDCLRQDLPVTHPDPWGLRVTLLFMFPTRLFLGRGTFGTFSALAFDFWLQLLSNFSTKKQLCSLQWDIIGLCSACRGRSNVLSLCESLSWSAVLCFYVYDSLIYWSKQWLIQKFQWWFQHSFTITNLVPCSCSHCLPTFHDFFNPITWLP